MAVIETIHPLNCYDIPMDLLCVLILIPCNYHVGIHCLGIISLDEFLASYI